MSFTCLYSKMKIGCQLHISQARSWQRLGSHGLISSDKVMTTIQVVEKLANSSIFIWVSMWNLFWWMDGRKLFQTRVSACLVSGWEQCCVCQDRCSMLVSDGISEDMESFHLRHFPFFVGLILVLPIHCAVLDKLYLERVVSYATVTWQKLLNTSTFFVLIEHFN